MPLNSKRKGKVGELEFAAALRELGVDARRGQQFSGSQESPDVETSLEGVHFEVKRTEKLQLHAAIRQAIGDAGSNVPVVASRRNRDDWLLTLRLSDLRRFAERVLGK